MPFKKFIIYVFIGSLLHAAPASSSDDTVNFTINSKVYKEWIYSTFPRLGLCQINNEIWWHLSETDTPERLKKVSKMMLENKVYADHLAFNFNYTPSKKIYTTYFQTRQIDLPEGKYELQFIYDGNINQKMFGYISKHAMPDEGFFGETYRNTLFLVHKDILREVVPNLRKFSNLEIVLNNKSLPSVSLMGFSKAYSSMQKCMGEAVHYDLKDPF